MEGTAILCGKICLCQNLMCANVYLGDLWICNIRHNLDVKKSIIMISYVKSVRASTKTGLLYKIVSMSTSVTIGNKITR